MRGSARAGGTAGVDGPGQAPRARERYPGRGTEEGSVVAVVAALPEEGEVVLEMLEESSAVNMPGEESGALPLLQRGLLAGVPAAVAVTGDGKLNARKGVAALFRTLSVDRLLVIGVGGALVPDLEPCSVILGREVWLDAGRRLRPPDRLLETARAAAGARTGVVVTVPELLVTAEAKAAALARVRERRPGDRLAVADLESGFYAAEAEKRRVPWLVLRGVSDGASESLPSFLERCRDENGAILRSAVVRHAFFHPSVLPDLMKLRRRVRCCAENLAGALKRLIEAAGPADGTGYRSTGTAPRGPVTGRGEQA